MSATIEQEKPVEAPETPEGPPHTADAQRFGKWTDFIDLGEGAENCPEHGADCQEPGHFHVWVRLPNGLVHRDIRERALAAQARRMRLLRDPESDAGVVLENEIEELRAGGIKAGVVESLIQRDFAADYGKAVTDVQAREESPYERIAYDQEEFTRLDALPEDERNAEDYEALKKHLAEYAEEVNKARDEITGPKRQALEGREMDDLLVEYRAHRVDQEAAEVYLHIYGAWELIACSYHPKVNPTVGRPDKKVWHDLDALQEADEEHIEATREKFDELRANQARAVMGGNS